MPGLGALFAVSFGIEAASCEDLTEAERSAEMWLIALWPPGVSDLYDLGNPRSGVCNYFAALAQAFLKLGIEPVANLRVELNPATSVEKLPDWEAALGLQPGRRAATATVAGRQAAVVAKLRESGSYSLPELRAMIGPLLGYVDPTKLVIVETDRAGLKSRHTYTDLTHFIDIAGGGTVTQAVLVLDDAAVSAAGVELLLTNFNASDYDDLTITLQAPDGTAATWSGSGVLYSDDPIVLRSLAFVGKPIFGTWQLTVSSSAGNVNADDWRLFVEGAGRDAAGADGLGAVVFEWGPLLDGALAGAAGPVDVEAVNLVLSRVKPAHTRAYVIVKSRDASGAAIPDNAESIPDACIPG